MVHGIWISFVSSFLHFLRIKPVLINTSFQPSILAFFLIAMLWMAIHLYSRNFNINFMKTLHKTVIDVFATFLLLSHAKFVFASLKELCWNNGKKILKQKKL